jgi:hypothetical protein
MSGEKMTVEEMSKKYPNEWLFIIEPNTRKNTTHLVSGIVQVHSKSRDDVSEASRKFKGDAAIRWTGDDTSQERRPKMPLYRPRNLN